MNFSIKVGLVLIFLLPVSVVAELKKDNSNVEIRQPSAEKMKEYYNSPDFLYDRVPPPPTSWWQRFQRWLASKINQAVSFKGSNVLWKIIRFLLVVAAIVGAVILLFKSGISSIFMGTPAKNASLDFNAIEENIHGFDFDKLIEECEAKKNYRKAIRLHYLKLLKILTDRQIIDWKPEKTNMDYFAELAGKQQLVFGKLSHWYEYTWYGNFEVSTEHYKTVSGKFREAYV